MAVYVASVHGDKLSFRLEMESVDRRVGRIVRIARIPAGSTGRRSMSKKRSRQS